VERVMRLTGSSSQVVRRPLPVDDPQRRRPDISYAQTLLGWSPRTPIDAGLQAVIAWFRAEAEPSAAAPPDWREPAGVARAV
jgi:UDP-glucuronate decarboxylase